MFLWNHNDVDELVWQNDTDYYVHGLVHLNGSVIAGTHPGDNLYLCSLEFLMFSVFLDCNSILAVNCVRVVMGVRTYNYGGNVDADVFSVLASMSFSYS